MIKDNIINWIEIENFIESFPGKIGRVLWCIDNSRFNKDIGYYDRKFENKNDVIKFIKDLQNYKGLILESVMFLTNSGDNFSYNSIINYPKLQIPTEEKMSKNREHLIRAILSGLSFFFGFMVAKLFL